MRRAEVGKSLVIDPEVCHGQMTFRGGHVFISDPETGAVQQYLPTGELQRTYDLDATGYLNPGITNGIAAGPDGSLRVSHAGPGVGTLVRILPQP